MKKRPAALDGFRLFAALLVVCIHTSPLASLNADADFWLTRVLARVGVPFFFLVSGYFLAKDDWRGVGRFTRHTALLYAASILLYLPLNLYAESFPLSELPRKLLFDGTFYHLWYLPAVILGVWIARGLSRFHPRTAFSLAGVLYLIGLGGDSYYGLIAQIPVFKAFYRGLFHIFSYTRNGIFFAPLFLLLGAAGRKWNPRRSMFGFLSMLMLMTAEGFLLHRLGVQRHDSMYLTLPLVMLFLFSLLLHANAGQNRKTRSLSMLIYLIHPWCIVLVRGVAKALHAEQPLIANSLGHFFAVALLSLAGAVTLYALRPLPQRPAARAWREINREALLHNAAVLGQQAGPGCSLMAVVKADAYGHGMVPVARTLQKGGVRAFAVACLSEAIVLRKAGIRGVILVLGYTAPEDVPLLCRWRITQTIVDEAHAQALSAQGRRLPVHLALDTGMHRLGIPSRDTGALRRVFALPNLRIDGVFSHFCVSDCLEPAAVEYTGAQRDAFFGAVNRLRALGLDPGALHLQASYGLLNLPAQPCDFARAGVALYGVYSGNAPVVTPLDLRPVLSLRARVATVRHLPPGEHAGYGCAFTAQRETDLAVLAIGYADGLPRDLSAYGAQVLLHGQAAPVVGRVCMDQMFVDVTGLARVRSGDVATLIGKDGSACIRAEDLAEQCGTITNELLSRLGPRLAVQIV